MHSNNLIEAKNLSEYEKLEITEKLKASPNILNITELIQPDHTYTVLAYLKEKMETYRDLDEDIALHTALNPKLWDDQQKLFPEVRHKVIEIVKHFKDAVEEDGIKLIVTDIWLLGSNANYNYTPESDLDIHIIADESFDCSEEHLQKIYDAYKTLYNKKYDIAIKGINAEIYVENKDKLSAVSSGVYSLKNNAWLKKPSKFDIPRVDEVKLANEINKWESKYEQIYANPSIEAIEKYMDDIYTLRKNSIASAGEFGIGNLTFKEMRRCGYLDNLKEIKT